MRRCDVGLRQSVGSVGCRITLWDRYDRSCKWRIMRGIPWPTTFRRANVEGQPLIISESVRIVTAVVFSELKTSITNLSQNIPDRRHGIYLIKEKFLNISNVVSFFSIFESGNFAAHLQMVRSLRARIHMSGFTRLSENFIIQLFFRCTSREASAITRLHFSGPVHLIHARPKKNLQSITNSALSHSHDCFRSQPRLLGRSLVKIHLDQRRQHIPR